MKIRQLSIEGFRSLKNVVWEPGDLNVLIGPNGSGKSNFWCLRTPGSPSPQPSPRRGGSAAWLPDFQSVLDLPPRCRRFSLSPWERAGVRGIGLAKHQTA
jgi:hypothetical protein